MKDKNVQKSYSEKIKVTSLEVVVHGTKAKPYYEIKYFDLLDKKWHIGYSSFNLNLVLEWKDKFFEVVDKPWVRILKSIGFRI